MAVIMGTAGHIDHGKTSLVRALTGIDCDRLEEEKRRGITIELGFAYFTLPDGERMGVVDVPGHERFVRNMVAGAAGIDFVNVSGADRTPAIVAEIRSRYPELPVIATGGPTEETILSTIAAGANAITYTPPSNGQLFAKDMHRYREWFAHIDDPEDEDVSEETSADDAE
mgnify:CR=1 FL=1